VRGQSGNAPGREFRRELRLLDAAMIVIGSMIGSGIFIVSADIARSVGSGGYLLLVWGITGAITVVGALSYGELAGMMPHAGGQYVYLRESYGPLVGFLYGWTLFTVIQTGTIAAVGVAFAKFSAVLFPSLSDAAFRVGAFAPTGSQFLAIASIIVLTWVNSRGLHGGRLLQDVFTFSKTAALVGLILLGAAVGWQPEVWSANLEAFWDAGRAMVASDGTVGVETLSGIALLSAIGVAMVGSLFSSDAWNNITFAAGEVVDPKRTIPLSLVLGTATVILLYLAANIVYLGILPLQGVPEGADAVARGIQFAEFDRVGTAAASVVFGEPAALIMAVLIMVSTFGCNNGLILAGARVYYAMAQDGLFFRNAGLLNQRSVPAAALWFQAVWAGALCLSGTYSDLLDYVVFAVLVFYILTVLGIFILRRTRPGAERPYRAWGYPVLPALYVAAAAAIAVNLLIMKPAYTWPGAVIVLLGIPVYRLWRMWSHH
jgi:APA family basic amino acid/polyamine antiporter